MPVIFTKEIKNKSEKYLDLDGAGIIYPYVAEKAWNSVYRVEAHLKYHVVFTALEDAVKEMKRKYPYFFMRLGTHGKKYVLKDGYSSNVIFKDAPLCRPFDLQGKETLLRVVYSQNTIGVEIFHSITDGHGAQMFFTELLKEYCKNVYSNYNFSSAEKTPLVFNEKLKDTSDIYHEIYKLGGKNVNRLLSSSYQFPKKSELNLTAKSINISFASLKATAHRYGVSVSVYLCAVQIAAILRTQPVKNKAIRISVPVDIRKFFDFDSCRNGALYFLVSVKPNEIKNFETLIRIVCKQFEENLTKDNLQNLAYTNVKTAKLKAYTLLPLSMKKAVLKIGYNRFGENQFTSTLTNLGIFNLDNSMKEIISDVYFILGKQKTKPVNLAVTTYESQTRIVVSSVYDSARLISAIREILISDGIESTTEELGLQTIPASQNI